LSQLSTFVCPVLVTGFMQPLHSCEFYLCGKVFFVNNQYTKSQLLFADHFPLIVHVPKNLYRLLSKNSEQ